MKIYEEYTRGAMAIFIFLLIVSGNYLGSLFPCRIQDTFEKNIWLQHVLGFFTMLFFVLLTFPRDDKSPINLSQLMSSTGLLYVSFILLTRTPAWVWLIVFVSFLFIYLLELQKENMKIEKTNNENKADIKKKIDNYSLTQDILASISGVLVLFGVMIYIGEKKLEYKKDFSYQKFIFGTPTCKGYTHEKNMLKSIGHIFD